MNDHLRRLPCPIRPGLLLAALLAAAPANAQPSGLWTPRGPSGINVHCLSSDRLNPSILFGCISRFESAPTLPDGSTTHSGFARSMDGGTSWTLLGQGLPSLTGPGGQGATAIAPDPELPTTVYALVNVFARAYLYRSADRGETWQATSFNVAAAQQMIVHPGATGTLYIRSSGRLFKLTGGGAHIGEIPPPRASGNPEIADVLVVPGSPARLLVLVGSESSAAIYETRTDGASWQLLPAPQFGGHWRRLLGSRVATGDVFALASASFRDRVYLRPGGSNGWQLQVSFQEEDDASLTEMVAHSDGVRWFLRSPLRGLLVHGTAGTRALVSPAELGQVVFPEVSPTPGGLLVLDGPTGTRVYAGTRGGVLRSRDSGNTWRYANSGLPPAPVTHVVVHPARSGTLVAATEHSGLFRSVDGGINWTSLGVPWPVRALAIAGAGPLHLAVAVERRPTAAALPQQVLLRSFDEGQTWTETAISASELAIHPADSRFLLRGRDMWRSVDAGANWHAPVPAFQWTAIAFDSLQPDVAYVGATGIEEGRRFGRILRTANRGLSYTPFADLSGEAIAVDPSNSQRIYAGAFATADGGKTWIETAVGAPQSFAFQPAPAALLASAPDAISRTTDHGLTWQVALHAPSNAMTFIRVAVDASGNTYTATNRGLYRNAGASAWVVSSSGGDAMFAASDVSTVVTGALWLRVVARSAASGPGTVWLRAEPSVPGQSRSASVTIGGEILAVEQRRGLRLSASHQDVRLRAVSASGEWQSASLTVRLATTGPFHTGWKVAAAPPWLSITPSSGTGGGDVQLRVSAGASIDAGQTLTGAVNFEADGSPDLVLPVTLEVAGGSTQAPFGAIDTPVQGTSGISGSIAVTGWALDDVGVRSVDIYRNCLAIDVPASCQSLAGSSLVFVGRAAFLPGARPDVESLHASLPAADRAGWGYLLLTNMLPHVPKGNPAGGGQGTLTLHAFATDVEGQITELGRRTITLDNDAAQRPFGAIDTPSQGATLSGVIPNFGWALTPGTARIPTTGAVIVFIDGGQALQITGPVTYNQCRGSGGNQPAPGTCDDDIATLFPTHTNITRGSGAIGSYLLDTTALSNGLHTIAWSVTDDAGRTEGIGSRFFTVLNGYSRTTADDVRAMAARRVGDARTLPGIGAGLVIGRSGFDITSPWHVIAPDDTGARAVTIPEIGRLEVEFGPEILSGYLRVRDELRPLPPGSHLAHGRFTWAPGAGYYGRYDLVFVGPGGQLPIAVTIVTPGRQEARVAAALDLPVEGDTSGERFTVAGWAIDREAMTGAGIGAVHVWAFRRDAPSLPVFLGTSALDGFRPDVADAHGPQFARSGWSLTAPPLPAGDYEVVAYFWTTRTATFEDARRVRVRVR